MKINQMIENIKNIIKDMERLMKQLQEIKFFMEMPIKNVQVL